MQTGILVKQCWESGRGRSKSNRAAHLLNEIHQKVASHLLEKLHTIWERDAANNVKCLCQIYMGCWLAQNTGTQHPRGG